MRGLILAFASWLAFCGAALATADAEHVYTDPAALHAALENPADGATPRLHAFVAGLEKGLAIANSRLLHGKKPRLYCDPNGETFDERALVDLYKAEYRRMVDEYGAAYVKNMTPSFVMLHAFEKKYPCP